MLALIVSSVLKNRNTKQGIREDVVLEEKCAEKSY